MQQSISEIKLRKSLFEEEKEEKYKAYKKHSLLIMRKARKKKRVRKKKEAIWKVTNKKTINKLVKNMSHMLYDCYYYHT